MNTTHPMQFQEPVRGLVAGDFSRFAPLFDSAARGSPCSITGMPAKPVIDIMAAVSSLEAARPAIDVLMEAGYVHFPYRPDIMHWFCKPSAAFRTHHLHLVPSGSRRWVECPAFRDAIHSDSTLATEYATLNSGSQSSPVRPGSLYRR